MGKSELREGIERVARPALTSEVVFNHEMNLR